MAERWNINRAKELFSQRGCTLLETVYVNTQTPMQYIATCGHIHNIAISNFKSGKGDLCRECRYTSNGRKRSLGDQALRAVFEEAGCVVISDYIKTVTQKVKYIALCGHENEITYNRFKAGGGRICSKCSKSIRYELDYVREVFEQNDCELLENEYINCKTPMRYIALCGHESVITFDVFQNAANASRRCRECHKHSYNEVPVERNFTAMKVWRKEVYAHDDYRCVACGKHRDDLNAHHLDSYDTYKDGRLDVGNGVTLCASCHTKFHQTYGFGGNSRSQFNQWIREYRGKLVE